MNMGEIHDSVGRLDYELNSSQEIFDSLWTHPDALFEAHHAL